MVWGKRAAETRERTYVILHVKVGIVIDENEGTRLHRSLCREMECAKSILQECDSMTEKWYLHCFISLFSLHSLSLSLLSSLFSLSISTPIKYILYILFSSFLHWITHRFRDQTIQIAQQHKCTPSTNLVAAIYILIFVKAFHALFHMCIKNSFMKCKARIRFLSPKTEIMSKVI